MIHQLDVRRLLCPLPVIRLQDKVKDLAMDDIVEMLCTDPGVLHDIPTWCRMQGHEVLEIQQEKYEITMRIKIISRGSR